MISLNENGQWEWVSENLKEAIWGNIFGQTTKLIKKMKRGVKNKTKIVSDI